MARARDEAGNIWEVDAQGNPIALVQAAQGGGGGVFRDPYRASAEGRAAEDQEIQRSQLDLERQRTGIAQQQAAINAALGQMNIQQGQMELSDAERERADFENVTAQKDIRQRLRMGNVLENVRRVRNIAEQGGTGWQSLLSAVPESSARELEAALRPIRATLAFDRLQEMRDESKTGGALGAVSEKELALLEGAVAALDAGVSKGSFLDSLDQIERHFVGSQLALSGIDPESDEGRSFYGEYGVDMPQEGRALNQRQRNVFDAVMEANPDASPEQLRAIFEAAGVPPISNLDEVVEARRQGLGVSGEDTYQDSILGQGMSGVNEGIADILGFPVDMMAGAMNLGSRGINALTNSQIPAIEDPVLGSQWMRNLMGDGLIYDQTDDPTSQFARRVGQSVGSASVPVGAMANTARQAGAGMLAAAGGGIGGATAQQVAPGNVGAEIAAELLGGGLAGGGLAMARRGAAQREIESAIPSTQELRDASGAAYKRAEELGASAGPSETQDLADIIRSSLVDESQIGPAGQLIRTDGSTNNAYNLINQYAGTPMSPGQMNSVRKVLSDGRSSMDPSDQRIASILTEQFDDWARPMVPQFDEARDLYRRARSGETLEDVRRNAGTRSSANALRNEYAGLARREIKGTENFTPEVSQAVDSVVTGSPGTRALDLMGKAAPTGVVSGGLSAGVPFSIGTALGGPALGGAMSAISLGGGTAARALANRSINRRAEIAELLARNGAPIEQAPLVDEDTRRLITALLVGQQSGISE